MASFELPIRYSAGGSMTGSMSMVVAALARGAVLLTAANGGSQAISSASVGRAGWTVSPIATSSPLEEKAVSWVRNDGRSGTGADRRSPVKALVTILTVILALGFTAPVPRNQSACEKAGMK